jgi:hypothetical protein
VFSDLGPHLQFGEVVTVNSDNCHVQWCVGWERPRTASAGEISRKRTGSSVRNLRCEEGF